MRSIKTISFLRNQSDVVICRIHNNHMRRDFYGLLSGFLIVFLFGCESLPESPSEGDTYRTVIAYWVADNASGDLSSYAISDFNEMLEGMQSVDISKNHLVIYIETKKDLPHLIHVKKENNEIVADTILTYEEQNPLNVEVMTNVMTFAIDKFPSEHYGLIFASHADGWFQASNSATRHIGDYRGTQMNITDFSTVLKKLPHFDFILFDACYMQSIEVAYELKDYTDYIIASPTEIPGPGAPYQRIVPLMFASKKNVSIDVGRGYYEYYGADNGDISSASYISNNFSYEWVSGVSISVILTSKLNELAAATKDIFTGYSDNREIINIDNLFDYGCDSNGNIYYYDMDGLIRQITNENGDYDTWRKAFDEAQVYFKTTTTNNANRKGGSFSMIGAGGVSIYVPENASSVQHQYYKTLSWYKDGGWEAIGW